MSVDVKSWSQAGAVLLTAGAIAVAPLTAPPPPTLHSAVNTTQVSHQIQVELAATAGPLEAAGAIIQGIIDSAGRAATAVVGIPAGLLALVSAITTGTQDDVTALVNNVISAPLWVADPTLIASNAVLPKSIGQGGNLLTGATNSLVASLRNLALYPATKAVESLADNGIDLAYGATQSLVNAVKYVVGAPAALGPIVQAMFAGDRVALYNAILPITTGVTWMVDPVLNALNRILPAPFGQAGNIKAGATNSWVASFRNNVVWTVSRLVNVVIAKILGVPGPPPNSQGTPIPTAAAPAANAAASVTVTPKAAAVAAGSAADTTTVTTSKPKVKVHQHKDKTAATAGTTDAATGVTDSDDNAAKPAKHDHKSGKTDSTKTHQQKSPNHKRHKTSGAASHASKSGSSHNAA
jgi:hypothetical protein